MRAMLMLEGMMFLVLADDRGGGDGRDEADVDVSKVPDHGTAARPGHAGRPWNGFMTADW